GGDCRVVGCASHSSHCINRFTLATSNTTGTCDTNTGQCSYVFTRTPCTSPPTGTCNGNALTWSESPGACVEANGAASCVYPTTTSTCASGCAGGKCNDINCSSGAHVCGNACVSNADVAHCGTVNCLACPAIDHASPSCESSACTMTCDPGYLRCGELCAACPSGTVAGQCREDNTCYAIACGTSQGGWAGNGRCYEASSSTPITSGNAVYPKIAFGAGGLMHLAYTDYSSTTSTPIVYRTWNRTSFSAPIAVTSTPGVVVGLTLDSQERPQIVFTSNVSTNTRMRLAAWNGSAFVISEVSQTLDLTYALTSSVGAIGDQVHVAYAATTSTGTMLVHTTAQQGQAPVTEFVARASGGAGLAISHGSLILTASTSTGVLVATKSGDVWTQSVIATSSTPVRTRVAVSPSGGTFVLESDSSGNNRLYAPGTGGAPRAFTGSFETALVADAQEQPVMVSESEITSSSTYMQLITNLTGRTGDSLYAIRIPSFGEEVALAADPLGGYALVYRTYSGNLVLWHFQ
ncbi:MAG: hypothetical protein JST92_08110, partial [Deltaproteobacteria bacterium]|nr:hypothetical protein [Deltaproteobacteria bacterium]